MKYEIKNVEEVQKFKPFKIEFTIEDEEDLGNIYAAVGKTTGDPLWKLYNYLGCKIEDLETNAKRS